MKILSLVLSFWMLSMSVSCDKKLIRPKGSDKDWAERQEDYGAHRGGYQTNEQIREMDENEKYQTGRQH